MTRGKLPCLARVLISTLQSRSGMPWWHAVAIAIAGRVGWSLEAPRWNLFGCRIETGGRATRVVGGS
uniref:Uncharacterized protein n=1 Tax=Arundo donax TaxID=35708 RepID=A0A0A9CCP9_ARUDO